MLIARILLRIFGVGMLLIGGGALLTSLNDPSYGGLLFGVTVGGVGIVLLLSTMLIPRRPKQTVVLR